MAQNNHKRKNYRIEIGMEEEDSLKAGMKTALRWFEHFLLLVFVIGMLVIWPFMIRISMTGEEYAAFWKSLLFRGLLVNAVWLLAYLAYMYFRGYSSFAVVLLISFFINLVTFTAVLYSNSALVLSLLPGKVVGGFVTFYINLLLALLTAPVPSLVVAGIVEFVSRLVLNLLGMEER